jgi:hypothetical protein
MLSVGDGQYNISAIHPFERGCQMRQEFGRKNRPGVWPDDGLDGKEIF